MREALLRCCRFDWSRISPAIFGALFQEVMTDTERRHIGAHYTSERDILKVIDPLFMDGLRAELLSIENDRSTRRASRLAELRERLTQLRFLDPACGCGNFLVIAYRELRALELDLLKLLNPGQQQSMSLEEVNRLSRIDVDQFYGIEIEEWPARIAEVALWLTDHQSNMRIHEAFSQPCLRLRLRNSPHIHHGNALRMDWNTLLPHAQCSFILGNPPFVGKSLMSVDQKYDMALIVREAGGIAGSGVLDYVTAWYIKAAAYIDGTSIEVAFVSTNSIAQGEQPGILWNYLFSNFRVTINFAYQTFVWTSEARGKAHVHVVIISFAQVTRTEKHLLTQAGDEPATTKQSAYSISPYLLVGPNSCLLPRPRPIALVPSFLYGNKPADGGFLVLDAAEKDAIAAQSPGVLEVVREMVSAEEFLNGKRRFCLWMPKGCPKSLIGIPEIERRLQAVRDFRSKSKKLPTNSMAAHPALFAEVRQPKTPYICFPRHSSETRRYIPIGFLEPEIIVHDSCSALPDANMFHFGVLTSAMHMAWIKRVAGRLKSDFRYSNTLIYNNYPWPTTTPLERTKIEALAQMVLDRRSEFPTFTLANLYDPLYMPPLLLKAHQALDKAVDRLYRPEPFSDDQARVEHLFRLYEQLTTPLLPTTHRRSRRRSSST